MFHEKRFETVKEEALSDSASVIAKKKKEELDKIDFIRSKLNSFILNLF